MARKGMPLIVIQRHSGTPASASRPDLHLVGAFWWNLRRLGRGSGHRHCRWSDGPPSSAPPQAAWVKDGGGQNEDQQRAH
jgi:hypothetical protein